MDQSETHFFFAETNQRQSCSRDAQSSWSLSSTCAEELWVEIVRRCVLKTMYNITIMRFGFCDILNNQGLGKCYQPRPSARLITLTSTLIIPDITKTSSNNCLQSTKLSDLFNHEYDKRLKRNLKKFSLDRESGEAGASRWPDAKKNRGTFLWIFH